MSERGSITNVLSAFSAGDADAFRTIWERYLPRVTRLADRVLANRPRAVCDEHDVAQSAFASFWRRANQAGFPQLDNRDDLWAILSTITTRKALAQIRAETAEKRGGLVRQVALDDAAVTTASPHYNDIDVVCDELLTRLGEDELQTIALMRLMGFSNPEIAAELDCSLRRIERKVQLIKATWIDSGS